MFTKSSVLFSMLIITSSVFNASYATDEQQYRQSYPLHAAVKYGSLEEVECLINSGCNVNEQNIEGEPLHIAALAGNANVCRLLLHYGAKVNGAKVNVFRERIERSPLHLAAVKGSVDVIRFLLENRAAIDTQDSHKYTPLHTAVALGHVDVVRLLLENGALINARNCRQQTPLDLTPTWAPDIDQLLRDWPLYEAYLRRQGLLMHETVAAMRSEQALAVLAFLMATHRRLGAVSPVCVLDDALHRFISRLLTSYHSLEAIRRIADQERRSKQGGQK